MIEIREKVVREYVLTLTEEQAETLMTVLRLVAGDPLRSPRFHLEKILTDLQSADVNPKYNDLTYGTITFVTPE